MSEIKNGSLDLDSQVEPVDISPFKGLIPVINFPQAWIMEQVCACPEWPSILVTNFVIFAVIFELAATVAVQPKFGAQSC